MRTKRTAIIIIGKCDLAFRIRSEDGIGVSLTYFGKLFENLVRIMDCRRHQDIGLAAGIAEHQTLITCALILVVTFIDAHRDIGRLLMKVVLEFQMRVMKFFLLIADIGNGTANRALDRCQNAGELVLRGANFTANNHPVGCGKGFTGNACLGLFGQKQVENSVRYAVTQLVGMPF